MEVRNKTRNHTLGTSVRTAPGVIARMRGLLRTDNLPEGEGLRIRPCRGIHSIGTKCAFDAPFIDRSMKGIGACKRFPRNRISRIFPSADGVIDLPARTIERTGTRVGDEIAFRETRPRLESAGTSRPPPPFDGAAPGSRPLNASSVSPWRPRRPSSALRGPLPLPT